MSASRLAWVPLAGIFAFLLAFFFLADIENIVSRVADDAAYYFEIAENIAAGLGPTADGANPTNGYQPLWLLCLIPLAWLFDAAPETMLRGYLLMQTAFLLVAGRLFLGFHSKVFSGLTIVLASLLFAILVFFQSAAGMESGLLILTMGMLFCYGHRARVFVDAGSGRILVFGLLLGLVMLARLDMVFLGVSTCAACLWQTAAATSWRKGFARCSLVILGASAVVAPYLLYNWSEFGAVTPVSGVIKSSFPHASFSLRSLEHVGVLHLGFAAAACVYLAIVVARPDWTRAADGKLGFFRGAMAVLAGAVVLHLLYTTFFMKWGIFRWHFMPYALFGSFVASEPVEWAIRQRSAVIRRAVGAGTLIVLVIGIYGVVHRTWVVALDDSWQVRSYRAAVWAREHTPESAVFGMKDSGYFGFFSERRVINLDGVANNLEYQEILRSQRLHEYFQEQGVRYLVQHAIARGDRNLLQDIHGESVSGGDYDWIGLRYKSQLHDTHADTIVVRRRCEAYRSRTAPRGDAWTLLVWELCE